MYNFIAQQYLPPGAWSPSITIYLTAFTLFVLPIPILITDSKRPSLQFLPVSLGDWLGGKKAGFGLPYHLVAPRYRGDSPRPPRVPTSVLAIHSPWQKEAAAGSPAAEHVPFVLPNSELIRFWPPWALWG